LPLYWLSFHGNTDVEKILSTIEFAIEVYNVSFVVLDTLQFMLSDLVDGSKKFDLQDKVMARLRKIATNYKVHIAIVIHPRKTEENEDIHIHEIYGTSKATQ
jgi:twinkle protein